jgi:hypothetical protein
VIEKHEIEALNALFPNFLVYLCMKIMAMKELVLEIQRESDLKELLPVLDRLKIKYVSRKKVSKPSSKDIEEALRIIRAGADFSYLGDPVAWQREQRTDRDLPYYHIAEH